ncbi:actinin alpha 2, partial [Gamsiella multidivaricata]
DSLQNKPFTADELAQFKELFTSYDKNNDGRVDRTELYELTKSLGEAVTNEELDFVIKNFDTDGDGALDYDEFVELMATLRAVGRD